MRVLVDAHMIGGQETGNETYAVNLLRHLSQLPEIQCGAAVLPDATILGQLSNVEFIPLNPSGNWSRLLYALSAVSRSWKADILHVTYVAPFFSPCPVVVSVHDVSFKRHPEFFSPRDRFLFDTLLPITLRRASAVITLSNHAKQEILTFYPYLQGKVYEIPLAPGPLFRPVYEEESLRVVRARYGIRPEFVLAVGNLQPRKNLLRLIAAFASIRHQIDSVQLVIAGKAQWQSSAIYQAVRRLGVESDVLFTGYIPEEDLVLLYNAAKAFVYPSVYEGFGLPLLEAMTCGTPVITSNASAMPEVVEDAAVLVNPYQEEEIAVALLRVLTDFDLASSLVTKGLKRAQAFSWCKTAQETSSVYAEVLDRAG